MLNLGQLANTVQKNCDISDARHAGDYTLCVFLLKMREYYRWENEIPFSGSLPNQDVGEWLQERERMWNALEASPFEPLPLESGSHDPFDTGPVNAELVPRGYVYSGGYGRFSKPHFFLGDLVREERRQGFTVYLSSCEYARDLVAPPAMLQGNDIYVRQESVRRFLWERIEETRGNRSNTAMARVREWYGFDRDLDDALERMTQNETESMILHELGEGQAGRLLGDEWNDMLVGLTRSKAEIMARAVRDLLADCLSTLPALIARENVPGIHFHFATFGGMRRYLFPEAMEAYARFAADGDLGALRRAVRQGVDRWGETAQTIERLYRERGEEAAPAVEQLLEHTPI
jgi:hypothetical protein